MSAVPANAVPVPAARRVPGSGRTPVVGELSTARADSEVVVDRFGNVNVVQKRPLSDGELLRARPKAERVFAVYENFLKLSDPTDRPTDRP